MSSKDIGEYSGVLESLSQNIVRTSVFNFRQVNLISDDPRGNLIRRWECLAADHDRCRGYYYYGSQAHFRLGNYLDKMEVSELGRLERDHIGLWARECGKDTKG